MSDFTKRLRQIESENSECSILAGNCADAIEIEQKKVAIEIARLRAENETLRAATTPICVGRRIIGILAKEGAWTSETGASVVAADELFRNDPYEVIAKLRAALDCFMGKETPTQWRYGRNHAEEMAKGILAAAAALNQE